MRISDYPLKGFPGAQLRAYLLDDGEFQRKGLLRKAALICPGGGYAFVSKDEGEPVAMAFLREGFQAFVLTYDVTIKHPMPEPLFEAAAAILLIREHEKEFFIKPHSLTAVGFSAGGNLALALGVFADQPLIKNRFVAGDCRPDNLILGYPAIQVKPTNRKLPSEVEKMMADGLIPDFRGPSIQEIMLGKQNPSAQEVDSLNLLQFFHEGMPPIFCFGTFEDPVIPVDDLVELGKSCQEFHIPLELHIFEWGTHGLSLADPTVKSPMELAHNHVGDWVAMAFQWLNEQSSPSR